MKFGSNFYDFSLLLHLHDFFWAKNSSVPNYKKKTHKLEFFRGKRTNGKQLVETIAILAPFFRLTVFFLFIWMGFSEVKVKGSRER